MGILRRAVAYDGLDARVLPHELLHAQPAATVPLADTVVRGADDDHVAARVPCHRHPSSTYDKSNLNIVNIYEVLIKVGIRKRSWSGGWTQTKYTKLQWLTFN